MQLDPNNPVVKLCIEGLKAEAQGRPTDAGQLFGQAWEVRQNDLDACVAAHYLARQQDTPAAQLHWNQIALEHAEALEALEALERVFPAPVEASRSL